MKTIFPIVILAIIGLAVIINRSKERNPSEPPPRMEAEETGSDDVVLDSEDAMDDDLAALLAGFDTEAPDDSEDSASDDDEEMDADLAALLASL